VVSTNPTIFRFGLYEVDLATMQLRKSGIKIKLQDQPFQILTMLLERPGEIVTREELQKRLWPEDTFVVFDVGLNSAVKKLRQALADDSGNPRFIETLYRRATAFWRRWKPGPRRAPRRPVATDTLLKRRGWALSSKRSRRRSRESEFRGTRKNSCQFFSLRRRSL